MQIREIKLRQFRNISEMRIEPDAHLNFFIGANGQGKTSILEGLSYLTTLRSFRGAKSEEVIRRGHDFSEVSCRLEEEGWRSDLKVVFTRQGERTSKTAFIDGKSFRSSTSYLSARYGSEEIGFHSIVFNPSDHDLVRGEPALRRQYLDRVLAAEDTEYLQAASRYQKVLEQRNALLKGDQRPAAEVLEGFTTALVDLGSWIVQRRLGWIDRVGKVLNQTAHEISPTQPDLSIHYRSNWWVENGRKSIEIDNLSQDHFSGQSPVPPLDFLRSSFWKGLSNSAENEWRAGSTLVGPHRDDWALVFGGAPLRGHGSQGEVRSALIALKLSEIELFRMTTGHRPILLLDDFSSELDRSRREFLLGFLSETDLQVFVTSTEDPPVPGRIFRVTDGGIE